jgi:hypothetical protein
VELTREEVELERVLEDAPVRHSGERDDEVMNGATAAQDALKDHSGPGWGDFQMERVERVPNRSARP